MEDVTDTVFRRVVAHCARPDIFFTEFTNCEGLQSAGRNIVGRRLQYTQEERPIIAQIWGMKPEAFYQTAKELVAMGFDGIDINFGCPEKSVVSHGACAALIDNKPRAAEIIQATKSGVNKKLPVSVKTRIGFKTIQTEEWISFLLVQHIDALTIHGRTARELSEVPAHWDEIGKAVTLRNSLGVDTIILGNGDVGSYAEALEKVKTYSVDGVMIGRGVFHNPWMFESHPIIHSIEERLELMKYHVQLFDKTWVRRKNYDILKRFFKIYISGFDGASEFRGRLMATRSPKEALNVVELYHGSQKV